ncbi:MAG: SDR family oxidoreductase [Phycisphaerales bacterium]|nr:MAG: SDR family oxidoreductase [Phycisphaerales bacterium]
MSRGHALVTGGARRVGRAIALELARAGLDVTITFDRSASDAKATAEAISARGVRGESIAFTLDDPKRVHEACVDLAAQWEHGRGLDVLVHNASVYGPMAVGAMDAGDAERVMRVNAISPLVMTAAFAGLLSRSKLEGGGSVVAMADIHAMGRPRRDHAAYSMSKAALVEMVRSLARDLAPKVRVNAVAPGVVAWPERGAESDRAMQEAYLSRVPLGRAGTVEDAAEVVRWLALEARYITGEIVRVDGGRWLA